MTILRTKKKQAEEKFPHFMALRTLITRLPIRTKSPACPGFLQLFSPWPHSWKFRRSSSIGSRLSTKASSNAIDQAMPQHLSLSKLWRLGYIPEVEGAERANESQEEGRSVEEDSPDQWKRRGAEIRREILPITRFVKNILHSKRYKDGDKLTPEDEKKVVEKLLPHHPSSQDKIGCGVDAIMVGRHSKYNSSRCLFIRRKDGQWTDFSYRKCLMGFIRMKYPFSAEKFIERYFRVL